MLEGNRFKCVLASAVAVSRTRPTPRTGISGCDSTDNTHQPTYSWDQLYGTDGTQTSGCHDEPGDLLSAFNRRNGKSKTSLWATVQGVLKEQLPEEGSRNEFQLKCYRKRALRKVQDGENQALADHFKCWF